ncbi:MAG: glutaredoxin 3 [Geminicoccaceae bacterium]
MAQVEIYTTPFCGFCARAKRLLQSKGVNFDEIDLSKQPNRRDEMIERSGGRHTVPQIFIDGRGIGGSDDLRALDSSGELDTLLNGTQNAGESAAQ